MHSKIKLGCGICFSLAQADYDEHFDMSQCHGLYYKLLEMRHGSKGNRKALEPGLKSLTIALNSPFLKLRSQQIVDLSQHCPIKRTLSLLSKVQFNIS